MSDAPSDQIAFNLKTIIEDGYVAPLLRLTEQTAAVRAGDLNNDGRDDLLIYKPYAQDATVTIVYGASDLRNIQGPVQGAIRDATHGFTLDTSAYPADVWRGVIALGDVNDDGADDFAVNQRVIVYGDQSDLTDAAPHRVLSDLVDAGRADIIEDWAAVAPNTIGDVNGDGIEDYRLSTGGSQYGPSTPYIIFGPRTPYDPATFWRDYEEGVDGIRIGWTDPLLLNAGAPDGDFNGDGIGDHLLNSWTNGPMLLSRGFRVVYGDGETRQVPRDFGINGLDPEDGFSFTYGETHPDLRQNIYPVRSAGDLNGDGIDDLLMRTPDNRLYVMPGFGPEGPILFGGYRADDMSGAPGIARVLLGRGKDTFTGHDGEDEVFGEQGLDTLHGGQGDDALYGGSERDSLHGGTGDDFLHGGRGFDWIYGGGGDDVILPGRGDGYLEGGAGRDVFVFREDWVRDGWNWNEIGDFNPVEDLIRLPESLRGEISITTHEQVPTIQYIQAAALPMTIALIGVRADEISIDDLIFV